MTKNQTLFAANLQVHGKITSKEQASSQKKKHKKNEGSNKQGSYKVLQTTRVLSTCMVINFFGR